MSKWRTNFTKIWEKCTGVQQRLHVLFETYRRTQMCPFARQQARQWDGMYSSFYSETRQTTAVARFTLHQLYSRLNSKQCTLNGKLGGNGTNRHRPPFLPSGSWLSIMTTGQSNIGMRLHGYWVIWDCTNFKAAGNLRSWITWRFCDVPAANPQRGRKYFESLLWPLGQGSLTSQDSTTIPENLKGNSARQYRGDSGSERAGDDDAWGGE